jgi:Ni,Fe-hydrogenase maturation factor
MTKRILVLGLGNILLSDERESGVRVERLAETYRLGPRLRRSTAARWASTCCTGWTATDLFIADAVKMGGAPGDLVRLEGTRSRPGWRSRCRCTRCGLQELLAVSSTWHAAPRQCCGAWNRSP